MNDSTYNAQSKTDVEDFQSLREVFVVIAQAPDGFLHLALAHSVSRAL